MLPTDQLLEEMRALTDEEACNALLLGLKVIKETTNDPNTMREYVITFINALRLAEAGRIQVRDEGAN